MTRFRRIRLAFDEPPPPETLRMARRWRGLAADHVRMNSGQAFEFRWTGRQHYVALHDVTRRDAETSIEGLPTVKQRDIRDTLTFVPGGRRVSGWAVPSRRSNAFTAVYLDPAELARALPDLAVAEPPDPRLYFRDEAIRSTILKIERLLRTPPGGDDLYAEQLALVLWIELHRARGPHPADDRSPVTLSKAHETLIREFVAANLASPISLADLAALTGLDQFRLVRAFRRATGTTPYQYVLSRRIERARELIGGTTLPLGEIARAVGFGDATQLTRAFRNRLGIAPSHLRRRPGAGRDPEDG